jgi:putative transposase
MERKINHCVYNINYHIVFCPKYRHKVIKGQVEELIKQIVQDICTTYGYTLIQMETMPDHVHIFLSAPPTVAPTEIVRKLKSITANRIFAAIDWLKKSISGAVDYGAEVTTLAPPETSVPKPSASIFKAQKSPGRG